MGVSDLRLRPMDAPSLLAECQVLGASAPVSGVPAGCSGIADSKRIGLFTIATCTAA